MSQKKFSQFQGQSPANELTLGVSGDLTGDLEKDLVLLGLRPLDPCSFQTVSASFSYP